MSEHGHNKTDLAGGAHAGGTDAVAPVQSDAAMEAAKTIGAMLQQARIAQQLSLDEISARLKIAVRKLELVERGDVGGLPDVTFAQGVMRAYARVLGIDLGALPTRLKVAATPVTLGLRPETGLGQSFTGRSSMDRSPLRARWLWVTVAVLVAGGAVLFGLEHARDWFAGQDSAVEAISVAAAEDAAPVSDTGVVVSALPAGSLQNALDASISASVPVAPSMVVAAASAPAATSEVATVTTVATTSATVPAAPVATGDVVMRFSGVVWYEVRDNAGKVIASGTSRAGEEQAVTGTAPYSFIFGNASGVAALKVAGQVIDIASYARNNVVRAKLPQ